MKQALIVGIDNYGGAPLKGCVNDANAMADVLATNGNGSRNFHVKLETNVQTKGQLRKMIRQLFDCETDMCLFYFSGHGYQNDIGGYIITPDSRADDFGIPMDEILQMANESEIKNKIIILDCCNSGAFGSPPMLNNAVFLKRGITVLTSSREDEPSIESKGQGLFTRLLLDALKGAAADLKGDITPGSVYAFIDQAIGSWGQRPLFKANIARFTSLRTINPSIEREILRKLVVFFPAADLEFPLDPSYEYTNVEVAVAANTAIFKELQKLEGVGLVMPIGEEHMYWAAQNSKACALTAIGRHYWQLVKDGRI